MHITSTDTIENYHTHTHTHTHTQTDEHNAWTCQKSGLCTRTHTCTHHAYIHIYTGTCTHTHTHTWAIIQTNQLWRSPGHNASTHQTKLLSLCTYMWMHTDTWSCCNVLKLRIPLRFSNASHMHTHAHACTCTHTHIHKHKLHKHPMYMYTHHSHCLSSHLKYLFVLLTSESSCTHPRFLTRGY